MTRSRAVKAVRWRAPKVLASRAGRIAAAALVIVATASGLSAAFAGTGAVPQRHGTNRRLVSPGTADQPGALPVAESHAGPGRWMDHQLLVRIPAWKGAQAGCRPTVRSLADTQSARTLPGGCGTPQLTAAAPRGYSPARLRAYLRLRGTGAGQTVAVVDAFDNPYAARDIAAYSGQFGLPAPCGVSSKKSGCFRFSVVHPHGFAGANAGWALESDLDVQTVHAVAPRASIILVEAYDDSFTSMFEAIDYAAGLKPAPVVISNSWGGPEFPGETAADGQCALARSLCVFSAGDNGNPGSYPAYDPFVLSVGGTHLELTPAGKVAFEVGLCCGQTNVNFATGGGVSAHEPRPAYQDSVSPYRGRGIPDVSFDADPLTGVPVHDTFGLDGQNGWFEAGGTSVGAPAWTGILAAADQLRAAAGKPPLAGAGFQAQRLIYARAHTAGFSDITQGADNLYQCTSPVQACQAHPGYDLVTGWGSPRPGIDETLATAR